MNPKAFIKMKTGAVIEIMLYPDIAPQAVRSFIYLAKHGVYDNHTIERVAPGQCVDLSFHAFHNDCAKYLIPNDTRSGTWLPVEPGTIVMGGYSADAMSGGECFFPLNRIDRWSGEFPVFGKIIFGMDEIFRIGGVELKFTGYEPYPGVRIMEPAEPEVIESVRVETFGIHYPEPMRLSNAELPDNWLL